MGKALVRLTKLGAEFYGKTVGDIISIEYNDLGMWVIKNDKGISKLISISSHENYFDVLMTK